MSGIFFLSSKSLSISIIAIVIGFCETCIKTKNERLGILFAGPTPYPSPFLFLGMGRGELASGYFAGDWGGA
jgi:hypothetical protein